MKVKRIEIQNFKGIVEANIDFNDDLNVFIGSNGAGKTTILEAIALNIFKFTSQFAPITSTLIRFLPENINYKANFCVIQLLTEIIKNREVSIIQTRGSFEPYTLLELKKINEQYKDFLPEFRLDLHPNKTTIPILKSVP